MRRSGAEASSALAARGAIYRSPLLWMVALAYGCNFMDRSIVGTLAQAIKADLALTDGQLGILQGFAYVVLYAFMGLPIAWLAERRNRVTILAVCLALWSAMTMVCGLAQSFFQLLLLRVGVGVGEAGCNPCSHAIIADAFAPGDRSRALSVYQIGATAGTALGAMCAGVIADQLGWRMAFVIVGAPGLLLAVAIKLVARDPVRTHQAPVSSPSVPRVGSVARHLVSSPALVHLIMGFTLASFASGGLGAFTQAYMVRAFGLTYGVVGAAFGLTGGLASAACLVMTGRLSDALTPRDARWHAWLPLIGVAVSMPFSAAAYWVADWRLALLASALNGFFLGWFIVPTVSAFHLLVGARRVASGMALILLFQNLVGLGGGPYVTGALIDLASQHFFAANGPGAFANLCPGGVARAGASAFLTRDCHASIVAATQVGLQSSLLIRLWACAHYALAARHVARELAA